MIKVIIDRFVASGMESTFEEFSKQIKVNASSFHGFAMGETLQDMENPHHYITISHWASLRDWNYWYCSDERRAITARLQPILQAPETYSVMKTVSNFRTQDRRKAS